MYMWWSFYLDGEGYQVVYAENKGAECIFPWRNFQDDRMIDKVLPNDEGNQNTPSL
jgi:hypothetical protein